MLLCHIHNVVTKKRDASTDLLRRLRAHMQQHNVDFIGGDFNMSAFSTVGDVFSDPDFSEPGNSFLWVLGALEDSNRKNIRFLIMPKRPYERDSHGCYKFNNGELALGPRDTTAHLTEARVWRGSELPLDQQGVTILGTPLGHPDSVSAQLQRDSSLWSTSLLGLTDLFNMRAHGADDRTTEFC